MPLVDVPLYVMTPEFGAASQLEKIDMLDFAEFVAINKFDRKGAADALRDVAKQVQRNKEAFRKMPHRRRCRSLAPWPAVSTTTACHGAVPGGVAAPCRSWACPSPAGRLPRVATRHSTHQVPIVPGARVRYLADIADTVRGYKQPRACEQSRAGASSCKQLKRHRRHAANRQARAPPRGGSRQRPGPGSARQLPGPPGQASCLAHVA